MTMNTIRLLMLNGLLFCCNSLNIKHVKLISVARAKSIAAAVISSIVVVGPVHFSMPIKTNSSSFHEILMNSASVGALTEEQEVINEAWRVVNQAYIDKTFNGLDWKAERLKAIKKEYKTKESAYVAAKAMLQTIGDPYTRFLTPEEYDSIAGLARGSSALNSGGIGVELSYQSELATNSAKINADISTSASQRKTAGAAIASVVLNSPAYNAGIQPNDVVISIDGKSMENLGLDTVASYLRGTPGSTAIITMERNGKLFDFNVKRAEIKFAGVTSELITLKGKKIGLITVKTFSKETAKDITTAISKLNMDGAMLYVIDLRHNPGGYFPGGIDSAKIFLPPGCTIVNVVNRNGISDTYATSDTSNPLTESPVYLVVDERTASASEIFSAALQENHRAMLLGKRTFGKARVQTLNQIFDGSGVAVTVSRYTTPLGHDINKVGIPVDLAGDCPYPSSVLECMPDNF